MFKRRIAWLLVIAMLLTQNGITIFADNNGITNGETVESIEETAETSRGERSSEPEETRRGEACEPVEEESTEMNADEETSRGERSSEPEETSRGEACEPVEEESTEANADEETSSGERSSEPEETRRGERSSEPEEEESTETNADNESLSTKSNADMDETALDDETDIASPSIIEKSEKKEDDLYGLIEPNKLVVRYNNSIGYSDLTWNEITPINQLEPQAWYIDGVQTECWYPGGADVAMNIRPYYTDEFTVATRDEYNDYSDIPYDTLLDYTKTYSFKSRRGNFYIVLTGWTKSQEKSRLVTGQTVQPDYFPGVQYTGVFSSYNETVDLYPVFKKSNSPVGNEYVNNAPVTIEFWQGYPWYEEEYRFDDAEDRYGPYITSYGAVSNGFVYYYDDETDTYHFLHNVNDPNSYNGDEEFWAYPKDVWDYQLSDDVKAKTHFQTIWGQVQNNKFSATIPGNPNITYESAELSFRKLVGFSHTRRSTVPSFLIGETYDNLLQYAAYEHGEYKLRLFPVYKNTNSSSGDTDYKIKFVMDDRFGRFKDDKTYEYDATMSDKEFYIPNEDDMEIKKETGGGYFSSDENWKSNWLFWGWSRVKHDYNFGMSNYNTSEPIQFDNVSNLTNEDFYTGYFKNEYANGHHYLDRFRHPLENTKLLGQFKVLKDPLIPATEDIVYYPLFVKRPKLRFEIREGFEWQNNWYFDEGNTYEYITRNLASIKQGDNEVQYVEYNYGDPNTAVPEIEYDENRFAHSHNSWSNYWLGGPVDWNDYIRYQGRMLPPIRRSTDVDHLVEMWKTKTFEDEVFPINDEYNNMARLSINLDLNPDIYELKDVECYRFSDKYGYYYDKIKYDDYSLTHAKYFTYYPVLIDKNELIKLEIDFDAKNAPFAELDPDIPWRKDPTYIEYRTFKDTANFYKNDAYDAAYIRNDAMIGWGYPAIDYVPEAAYFEKPDETFITENPGVNVSNENKLWKYYVLKELDSIDNELYSQSVFWAYDREGNKAYRISDVDYILYGNPPSGRADLKNVSSLYENGRLSPDNVLSIKLKYEPQKLKPKYIFYDAKDPSNPIAEFQVTNSYTDTVRAGAEFAATASQVIDLYQNGRLVSTEHPTIWDLTYSYTNQYNKDKNNGVIVTMNRVEIDSDAIKNGRIDLLTPTIRFYLNRSKKAELTFDIDTTNVESVTGKTNFMHNEAIATPSIVMKEEWTFDGWSIDGDDKVEDDKTVAEYIAAWKNSSDPEDITIKAIIRYTPYPTYTVKFVQIDNMSYGSNYNTYKTQSVKKYTGEGVKPITNPHTGYLIDSFKVVGNGVGSPSVAFPLTGFDSQSKFKINDDIAAVASTDNVLNFVPVLSFKDYTLEFRRDDNNWMSYNNPDASGKVIINNVHIGDNITAPPLTVNSGYKLVRSKSGYNNNEYKEKPFPTKLTLDVISKNGANADNVDTIVFIPIVEPYSLRFEVDEDGIASPSVTGTVAYPSSKEKDEVIPPTVTSNDKKYVFDKWEDSNGTQVDADDIKDAFDEWKNNNPSDDIVFRPVFRQSYTFTFVISDTAFNLAANEQLVFYESELSSLAVPAFTEKNEYLTDIWVDGAGNQVDIVEKINEWKDEISNETNQKNVIYTLRYKKAKMLKYIIPSQYATVDPSEKLEYSSKEVSSLVVPNFVRKKGYRFTDWIDKNNNVTDPLTWDGSDDLELTAQFKKLFILRFEIEDRYHDDTKVTSADPTERVFDQDDNIVAPKVYPVSGLNPGGWAIKANAKTEEIFEQSELDDFINKWQANGTKDEKLYYIFTEDTSINKIKFEVDANRGQFMTNDYFYTDKTKFDADKASISVIPKNGYMFTGWENVDDQNDTYMRALDIIWDGSITVTYRATFKTVAPSPNPNPKPNPSPNPSPSNDGGGGDSGGGAVSPPSGFNPENKNTPIINPNNPNNPNPNNPNNGSEMSIEEKFMNPPDIKFIIVNMDRDDSSSGNGGKSDGNDQNFLWETTDRVAWRLIQMDNIVENVDYTTTPEKDVVKSFYTKNCKFYEDGWCFLQYRGTHEWYHFAPNNIMDVGWFSKNGNLYYLQTDYNTTFGSMYTGIRDIDGVRYMFDKTGKLLGVLGFTAQFTNQ